MIAEGLVERMEERDLEGLEGVERDAHGHVRIAEVAFGDILKDRVQKRLAEFGVKATIVAKNIGYELRCADPIPYDMEYARDLGYSAAKYLIEGGNARHGEHVAERVPRRALREHHGPDDGARPRAHGRHRTATAT